MRSFVSADLLDGGDRVEHGPLVRSDPEGDE